MEELRFNSQLLHPEVKSIDRKTINDSIDSGRLTLPYYTKYEYTTLIGTRAQQIAEGAKALVSLDDLVTSDPQFVWKVAEKEVAEKKLAFIVIHRRLPTGISEFWNASELTKIH